jgi:REP element-mobilizing transposase RayT
MMAARSRGTWGGRRPGAGRKPGPNPKTPHRALARHTGKWPVLMTLQASIDTLRSRRALDAIAVAVAGANAVAPEHFRVVRFSVAPSHVYLIVEARDAGALSSGARSIAIRIARYVNNALSRSGRLWADRWRRRDLKTRADVQSARVHVPGEGVAPSSESPPGRAAGPRGKARSHRQSKARKRDA